MAVSKGASRFSHRVIPLSSGLLVGSLLCGGMVCAQQSANSPSAATVNDKSYHGSLGAYLPMNVLWRVETGGGDRTITADPTERGAYPFDGALFYVSASNQTGTVPLYRLFNGSDHMVSLDPNEARGYVVEQILGYPFVSRQPGTSELVRTYNPSTGRHSLRNDTGLETEQGYTDEPLHIYGYPRYYNQSERLLSLSGGGITADSNLVAGGALWHWTWSGVQVINNWDHGRQTQTDIFPVDYANPTEAGDTWSNYPTPAVNHGSPVLVAENNGLTQRTRSITLEYDPDGTQQCHGIQPIGPCPGFGGGQSHPVVFRDVVLGKDLTLDFHGLGPVALYSTFMRVPKTLAVHTSREIPVIYARASFYRMFTYDAQTGQLVENPCASGPVTFSPNYGGVIAAAGDEKTAIGIYGVNTIQGGSVEHLSLTFTWSCPGPPAHTGEGDFDTMYLNAVRYTGYAAGTTVTNVYVVSGTLKTVVEKMGALYKLRDSIPK
jgi:hypothetical protein